MKTKSCVNSIFKKHLLIAYAIDFIGFLVTKSYKKIYLNIKNLNHDRESLALLQGLLICAECGRKIYVRYTGNGGIYPVYQCTWRKRDGLSPTHCLHIACRLLDAAIGERIVEILQPAEIKVAIGAFEELQHRSSAIDRQWQLKIQRAEYEARLAQRRYEEVDPANRLVAATLEKRWNDTLVNLDEIRRQYETHQKKAGLADIAKRKSDILALGKDLPRLWRSKTTNPKDRKRILRLLIKDITVKKPTGEKKINLSIRWQGGANEELCVEIPPNAPEKWRHSAAIVERVREMAKTLTDSQIAEQFNAEGLTSNKGNAYTVSSIAWIRYKHRIPAPQLKRPAEMTVKERESCLVYTTLQSSSRGILIHICTMRPVARKGLPSAKARTAISNSDSSASRPHHFWPTVPVQRVTHSNDNAL